MSHQKDGLHNTPGSYHVTPFQRTTKLLCRTCMEKRLSHNEELAQDFCDQIQAMIDRGAAVILSEDDISKWEGDYYYLALVGIKGKKK